MKQVGLAPLGATPTPGYRTVEWAPTTERLPGHLDAGVGPWLEEFGSPSPAAVSLARTATGVFVADRLVGRNELRQQRDIALRICVPDVEAMSSVRVDLEHLLRWLTGDLWALEFSEDGTERPAPVGALPPSTEVSLLSGGLDSFCGALISGVGARLFLSHSDAPVIKHSQNQTVGWMTRHALEPTQVNVHLAPPVELGIEPSRRSRSFLFIGLAVALADAVGATSVEVPENGFTSLNVPLAANRGGVLTTRSTHPWTFALLQRVLDGLGLEIALANPYEFSTKGELVAAAAEAVGADVVADGLVHTLSCAKSNPMVRGSGFGVGCGLDYACVVRRGGIAAAGIKDSTRYLAFTLNQTELSKLIELRRSDIHAVKLALMRTPDLERLLGAGGSFPDGYDFDRAMELWARGLKEIQLVELP